MYQEIKKWVDHRVSEEFMDLCEIKDFIEVYIIYKKKEFIYISLHKSIINN